MSTATTAPAEAPTTSSLATPAAQRWRSAKTPIAVALLVLLAGTVLVLSRGPAPASRLDPRSPAPSGGRAVAELLRRAGVQVDLVTTTAALVATARPGDTVLVTDPGLLGPAQVRDTVALGTDLVVLASTDPAGYLPGFVAEPQQADVRAPACSLAPAARSGRSDAGVIGYRPDPTGAAVLPLDTQLCYPADGVASLVQATTGGRAVTLVGSAAILTNDRLDDQGDAALALGLLGARPRLVWYLPTAGDGPVTARRTFYDLVPDGVWWGLGEGLVALLLLVLWRARRLGPLVVEPLPVVVRAAEAVEGRARLYRRTGARGPAADALRTGVRRRLGTALGLTLGAAPPTVLAAVGARSRLDPGRVRDLLYGAAPVDDAALVRLADALDALEKEVRRS